MQGLESHYYEREDGKVVVPLRVGTVNELFSSLDPSPFRDKDLDDDVEDYILEAAREIARGTPMKIVIYVEHDDPASGESVEASMHRFFRYRLDRRRLDLRRVLRDGRLSLVIGLVFLTTCLLARLLVAGSLSGTAGNVIGEGLLIMGWVAMWRPIQIFLYDWWPIRRRMARFARLETVEIEVRKAG
jgi:hypothetical protein